MQGHLSKPQRGEWRPVCWVVFGTLVMFGLGVFGLIHEILGAGRISVIGPSVGLMILSVHGVRMLGALTSWFGQSPPR